jgi:PRTRC genetic system protein A
MANLPSPISYHIHTGGALPPAWPYAYVLAANGLYKLVDHPHFYASLRLARARVAGLCRWPEEGVRLRVPRIPERWLWAVWEHARKAGGLRSIEQMYQFHRVDGGWRVAVPRQRAGAGHVVYEVGQDANVVLELHSHHEMRAFFSGIDNRDEQAARFYAVIGRIYSRPEIRLRLGVYGDFVELPAGCLFEGLGPFEEER